MIKLRLEGRGTSMLELYYEAETWVTERQEAFWSYQQKDANHKFYITYLKNKLYACFHSHKNCKKKTARFTNKFASNWTKMQAACNGHNRLAKEAENPELLPRWLSCYHLSRVKTAPGNGSFQRPFQPCIQQEPGFFSPAPVEVGRFIQWFTRF